MSRNQWTSPVPVPHLESGYRVPVPPVLAGSGTTGYQRYHYIVEGATAWEVSAIPTTRYGAGRSCCPRSTGNRLRLSRSQQGVKRTSGRKRQEDEMGGVKGRSGRRRLSVEHHIAHGTFRQDRHGPRPSRAAVATFPAPSLPEQVPASLVEALEAAGARFVAATWADYRGWSAPQQLLLTRCGQLVDAEATARGAGDTKLWLQLHRALLLTIAALGLKERA